MIELISVGKEDAGLLAMTDSATEIIEDTDGSAMAEMLATGTLVSRSDTAEFTAETTEAIGALGTRDATSETMGSTSETAEEAGRLENIEDTTDSTSETGTRVAAGVLRAGTLPGRLVGSSDTIDSTTELMEAIGASGTNEVIAEMMEPTSEIAEAGLFDTMESTADTMIEIG